MCGGKRSDELCERRLSVEQGMKKNKRVEIVTEVVKGSEFHLASRENEFQQALKVEMTI